MDIDQISEDFMEFRLHAYIVEQWENPLLKITVVNDYQEPGKNATPILINHKVAQCMWKPDIIFPNSKEVTIFQDTVPNKSFKLMPDGTIYRVERYLFKVTCAMEFSLYPMDSQHCTFKIGLMHNPDDKVTLHWSQEEGAPKSIKDHVPFKPIYPLEPLRFKFQNPRIDKKVEPWHTGSYTELWGNFTLHRRMTGSVINFYFPSTIVVTLSWLSFWIDVSAAPARVTLGVTALLTIATQIVQSRTLQPPVQYITGLDVWLFACLILIFASLIEYGVAYSYMPRKCQVRPNNKFAWGLNCQRPPEKESRESEVTASTNSKCKNGQSATTIQSLKFGGVINSNVFDNVSRYLFPLLMISFTLIYWTVICIMASCAVIN